MEDKTKIIIERSEYGVLKTPYSWARGVVTSMFNPRIPDRADVANVHVVPFIGRSCVLMHSKEAGWDIPGGTLEEGEPFEAAVTRELAEELGAKTVEFRLFAGWDSVSSSPTPYRHYQPHPNFSVALGWADVELVAAASEDGGVLQETVLELVVLPVPTACERLRAEGVPHLAAVYQLAAEIRRLESRNE